MRRLLAVGGSVAIVLAAAACGGTKTIVKTVQVQPKPSATGDLRYYGHIKTLTRSGTGYVLRFDPVWFLSGVTANVAQAEDAGTKCAPKACEPVPNDNYRVDEGHRVLTFLVPASVHGTVLTKGSNLFPGTTITAAELAKIVAGTSTLKLFEPLDSGVWILVHIDTVRTFAQQYVP
jgi:hypothetical protein